MAENEPGLLRKGDKVVVYDRNNPFTALEERTVARVAPGKYNGRALWLEGETGPARWDNDGWSRGGGPPLRIVSIAEWQARLAAQERDRQCTELREEAHRLGKAILDARGSQDPASFCDEILALLREAIPAWEARAAAAACLISGCKGECGSEKCRQEWADEQTPEQRAMEVMWNGEDRGGFVYQTLVLDDDQVNPSGDGWEDRRNYIRVMMEEEGEGEEVAAAEPIVARKGQPFFGVDAW